MKKSQLIGAALFVSIWLSGCNVAMRDNSTRPMIDSISSNQASLNTDSKTPSSTLYNIQKDQKQNSLPIESTPVPDLSAWEAGSCDDFNSKEFLRFLEQSRICEILTVPITSMEELSEDPYCTKLRAVLYEFQKSKDEENAIGVQKNAEGVPYYSSKRMEELTYQMFGLKIDFSQLEQELRSYFPAPQGNICVPWEIDYGHFVAYIDEDTISYENGTISVSAELSVGGSFGENDLYHSLRYEFLYLPNNTECQYMLRVITR